MCRRNGIPTACLTLIVCCVVNPLHARQEEEPTPQDITVGSSPDDRQIRVKVTDEDGRPVSRARLWIELDHPKYPEPQPGLPRQQATIHTKEDGVASAWYSPRPAGIVVSARGFAPQMLRNVELTKQDPFLIRLNKGQPIRGRVLLPDGQPAANAEVEAYADSNPWFQFIEFKWYDRRTAADGTFELPNAAPLEYRLSVHIRDEQSPAYVESVKVTVPPAAPPAPLELVAKPAAALEGTFISAHDVPVAKLWVRTYTEAPHFTNSDTVCKPDGSFVITALPPLSEGRIMAGYPPGYMPAYDALTEHGSFQQDGDILRFNCLPAGRHEGLVIRLLKAATVAGVVRDKDGKPVPNLRVLARRQGRSSRTDAEGRYEAPVMPDADVTLDFFTDFNSPPLAAASVRAAEGQRVEKDVVVPRRAPRQ